MKVGERGRVTIPKEIRDRFGIHANSEVDFEISMAQLFCASARLGCYSKGGKDIVSAASRNWDTVANGPLVICDFVYAELYIHFEEQSDCDSFLASNEIAVEPVTRAALFAGSRA